jgi:DNA replication protein DnaC
MSEPTTDTVAMGEEVTALLKAFKLPTMAAELVPRLLAGGHGDALAVVHEVLGMERNDRRERRIERLRYQSKLPPGKTLETFDLSRMPRALVAKVKDLARGEFVDQAVNVLAVGLPGTGKSHIGAALGHCLVERGHSVLYAPTFQLVQELLAAKRDLELPRALRKLDAFELIILDDIGYVQQAAEEVEVLFTLLAERYERRSVLITTNLVFSQWDQIFKNPMTTAAAIDRLVHHCVILEFNVKSYRSPRNRGSSDETPEPPPVDDGASAGGRRGKP